MTDHANWFRGRLIYRNGRLAGLAATELAPMLGADGRPRPELFRGDRLYLTDEGYRLWQSVVAPHLPMPPAVQP